MKSCVAVNTCSGTLASTPGGKTWLEMSRKGNQQGTNCRDTPILPLGQCHYDLLGCRPEFVQGAPTRWPLISVIQPKHAWWLQITLHSNHFHKSDFHPSQQTTGQGLCLRMLRVILKFAPNLVVSQLKTKQLCGAHTCILQILHSLMEDPSA